ncbi:MAG: hypothetical protein K8I27_05370 [Planctomycetes bacterium]|nr:hypothetical protein [Planctomycetota bacterium]
MTEPADNKHLPSDDELVAMLAKAEGRKPGKKPRRDPNEPAPRFPEALYYYLFILFEAVVLIGVWGFMRMGVNEALKGPSFEAPLTDQLLFHLKSIWVGFADVVVTQPWVPVGSALIVLPVFMPKTPKSRKRMATIVSSVLVGVFLLLIALQFSDDLSHAGAQF